jgi:hypothetical protein
MSMADAGLPTLQIYYWCVLGIVISIVLPIIRKMLPGPPVVGAAAAPPAFLSALWEHAKPYLVVGLFSLLTGILIVAFTYGTLKDWRAALLAGYAWDSTLQKLTKP